MRTPVQSRSTTSAERMLAAALELVAAGGLGAVTVAAVAERSGTSNGALYHRFSDRTGLLLAVQDHVMGQVEAGTAAAFAEAGREPDDERAVRLLAGAALAVFTAHRGAMRAFVVEARHAPGAERFAARTVVSTHLLARTVTGWLADRFGATAQDAESAWRVLLALGASRALLDDDEMSPAALADDDLADALARAVTAVVRPR